MTYFTVTVCGRRYILDVEGKPLTDSTVTAEHKLWWPMCEALYATTLAFTLTKEAKWMEVKINFESPCFHISSPAHINGSFIKCRFLTHDCPTSSF